MRTLLLLVALLVMSPAPGLADQKVDAIVKQHVLPGYAALEATSKALAAQSVLDCTPTSPALMNAFHATFDAWIGSSHLRFGPSEVDHRAFAIAFWPDPRSKTPKALNRLIADQDIAVDDAEAFAEVSVAARGLYALERMMFDPAFTDAAATPYGCKLIVAISHDLARTTQALAGDWQNRYADQMASAGRTGSLYKTPLEAEQELLKALATGLQFTSEIRLGRPLGTFDRPRPRRADARLSGRSLRNVALSVEALRQLAAMLSMDHPSVASALEHAFQDASNIAAGLVEDPVFAGVATVQGRFEVEILQQRINHVRELVRNELSPALGIGQGFNAMDGD